MKKIDEYKTTTNNRVYNIVHKELHASCSYCKWHPDFWHFSENQRYKTMHYFENDDERIRNCYSWKLSTKNKKQWMDKKYKIHKSQWRLNSDIYYVEYSW